MKNAFYCFLGAAFLAVWVQPAAGAEAQPALKDTKEKVSYSIGMNIGMNLKMGKYDVDVDILSGAIKDMLAGREPKLTEPQAREVMMAYQTELRAKRDEERKKLAEKNKELGAAFLAENKKKEGVKTQEVKLPDGSTAELQYKVLVEGKGAAPKSNDVVTVNYRATLITGKEFDNTTNRGPQKLMLNRDLRGRSEALQMMPAGSKWQLYLPSALAYGDNGFGANVEPGATVIFDLELVSAETPAPPAPPQPLTSDIIRVPSAEELKKGAKVEVLKAEDVEKMVKSGQTNIGATGTSPTPKK